MMIVEHVSPLILPLEFNFSLNFYLIPGRLSPCCNTGSANGISRNRIREIPTSVRGNMSPSLRFRPQQWKLVLSRRIKGQ